MTRVVEYYVIHEWWEHKWVWVQWDKFLTSMYVWRENLGYISHHFKDNVIVCNAQVHMRTLSVIGIVDDLFFQKVEDMTPSSNDSTWSNVLDIKIIPWGFIRIHGNEWNQWLYYEMTLDCEAWEQNLSCVQFVTLKLTLGLIWACKNMIS